MKQRGFLRLRLLLLLLGAQAAGLVAGCREPSVGPHGSGGGGGGGRGLDPDRGGGGFGVPGAAVDARGADACVKATCLPLGGRYCGRIGDGCGGQLECGGCPTGEVCGGGGLANVCATPPGAACKAIQCQQPGGRICGRVGDGCGQALECGACPSGETCGATRVCIKGGCERLCQQQKACPGGQATTVSGTIRAPTPPRFGAADPLYNVLVYVPNEPLSPFPPGVACEKCAAQVSGAPLTSTVTGPDGRFVLRDVPAGADIPLVLQIGRWRRQVTIPRVEACTDTPLPAELGRLPRNRQEGDIPRFAIATGAFDPIECLLRKIGIEDQEFALPNGEGRVHMYRHFGSRLEAGSAPGEMLTGDPATLGRYDIVLVPCDSRAPKPAAAVQNLVDYAARGGRLFFTDWSDTWLRPAPTFTPLTSWLPEPNHLGDNYRATVDRSFPKGEAFATWLRLVGATPMEASLPIHDIYNGGALARSVQPPSQRWLYTDAPATVQHFTFNTPVGTPPEQQCGRVIYSNFHVVPDPAAASPVFPSFCSEAPMTPQEKALEFMLFDAAACVQPDTEKPRVFEPPPLPPPPPPPMVD